MKTIPNISYGPESAQVLDVYLPEEKSFDVFVYFHGGSLWGGDKQEGALPAEYLTAHNVAVVSSNYRMYPDAVFPQYIDDAAQVVAWVVSHMGQYGECKRIFVGGSSAGGYLSMMLCYAPQYLANAGVALEQITGFVHDAGQPTTHFSVMKERGLNHKRVAVDEAAPLYFVCEDTKPKQALFIVSDNDIVNRYEQTMLMIQTLKVFGHGDDIVKLKVMHGSHCQYVYEKDEDGNSILGKIVADYINDATSAFGTAF